MSLVVDVLRTLTSDWNPLVQTLVLVQVTATPPGAVAAAAGSVLTAPTPIMNKTEVMRATARGRLVVMSVIVLIHYPGG
ncbi:hypothetical protein NicSoilB8_46650 (plasmid) [Arthrobacter sp. NicSoilB8]|nr:hypothetical protein NicSoilB8_46650 [Arthrobacter sp. NicSoilB8]